jgi:hypothetical protein
MNYFTCRTTLQNAFLCVVLISDYIREQRRKAMRNPKFDARPQNLTKLFESMNILSKDLITAIMHQRTHPESSWHDVVQSILDLQDLIIYFQAKIKRITLDELSHRTICSFEDYARKFIDRKRVYISKASESVKNHNYIKAKESANNTAVLLQHTGRNLKERFEQLIFEKVAAQKNETEEGSGFC